MQGEDGPHLSFPFDYFGYLWLCVGSFLHAHFRFQSCLQLPKNRFIKLVFCRLIHLCGITNSFSPEIQRSQKYDATETNQTSMNVHQQ